MRYIVSMLRKPIAVAGSFLSALVFHAVSVLGYKRVPHSNSVFCLWPGDLSRNFLLFKISICGTAGGALQQAALNCVSVSPSRNGPSQRQRQPQPHPKKPPVLSQVTAAMDLNASPKPEEEEELNLNDNDNDNDNENDNENEVTEVEQLLEMDDDQEDHDHDYPSHDASMESGVDVLRREREERRKRMRQQRDDRSNQASKTPRHEYRPNKSIPEGWIDCPAVGQPLSNLIPSKVPLGEDFNDSIAPGKRYSWRQVTHQQRVLGRELGLVIDLTNTTRYYNSQDWARNGIKHFKIKCKGRDSVPDNESVNTFVYEAMRFFHNAKQKNQNRYILVHCTHGHNRTGFMFVHYLVRTQGFTVSEAVQRFAAARPPGIYKPEYIDALFKFYHEKRPESLMCPDLPKWKKVDLNGNAADDDDDDGDIMAALKDVEEENATMTNDDVLGDSIPTAQQIEMQKICLLALGVESHGNSFFPGSQPVSLDRAHLQLLRQRYYYATWKADGTRYMMFITRDGSYLIDRKFNFRRVQVRFPRRGLPQGGFESHHLTLLDGEMIIDTLPDGRKKRRYLVYDLMMLNSVPQIKRPFHERWKAIQDDLIDPRQHDMKRSNSCYIYDHEPFGVRRKDFWMLIAVGKVLNDFIPKLSHEADGLIFQGWDDAYIPRTHDGLLKWKYAHMNSVDFLFEVGDNNEPSLFLMDKNRKRKLEKSSVRFPDEEDPSSFSGKIVECSWNPDDETWEFMRVRVDKSHPNAWNTYRKVMQSIHDNITQETLLEEVEDILKLPMYADRIKQDIQRIAQPGRRR